MGPGVGGTMLCVAKRPVARATAITAIDLAVSFASALLSGVRMT